MRCLLSLRPIVQYLEGARLRRGTWFLAVCAVVVALAPSAFSSHSASAVGTPLQSTDPIAAVHNPSDNSNFRQPMLLSRRMAAFTLPTDTLTLSARSQGQQHRRCRSSLVRAVRRAQERTTHSPLRSRSRTPSRLHLMQAGISILPIQETIELFELTQRVAATERQESLRRVSALPPV